MEYRLRLGGDFFGAGDLDFCGDRRLTGERDRLAGERRAGDLRAGDRDLRRRGDGRRLGGDRPPPLRPKPPLGGEESRPPKPPRPPLRGERFLNLDGWLFSLGISTATTEIT